MDELISTSDVIRALVKKGMSIVNGVTDFNFKEFVTKYVENGGYNNNKSLDENFSLLISVVANSKAMGKI